MTPGRGGVRALAGACALLLVAGCADAPDPRPPGRPLTIVTSLQFPTTDPVLAADEGSATLAYHVFQRLLTFEPGTDTAKPDAAECLYTAARVYTCTLERRIAFSDGTPVVAADVKFSLDRARALARPGTPAFQLRTIERVETSGQRVVRLHLREPDANLAHALASPAGSIVRSKDFPADGPRTDPGPPVGSGPWSIAAYAVDQVQLERWDKYVGPLPDDRPGRVTFQSAVSPELVERYVATDTADVLWQVGTPTPDPGATSRWHPITYAGAQRSRLAWNPDSSRRGDAALRAWVRDATAGLRTQPSNRPAPLTPQPRELPTGADTPATPPAEGVTLTLGHPARDARAALLADRVRQALERAPGVHVDVRPDDRGADLWLTYDHVATTGQLGLLQPWTDFPLPGREEAVRGLVEQYRRARTAAERDTATTALLEGAAHDAVVVALTQDDQTFTARKPLAARGEDVPAAGPDHQIGSWNLTW